jgi:hypothetical protein
MAFELSDISFIDAEIGTPRARTIIILVSNSLRSESIFTSVCVSIIPITAAADENIIAAGKRLKLPLSFKAVVLIEILNFIQTPPLIFFLIF